MAEDNIDPKYIETPADLPAEEPRPADAGESEAPTAPEPEKKKAKKQSAEEKLTAELAELQDKFLRLQADYSNYRKRMAKDLSGARMMGVMETVTPFLQVFDLFAMAVKAAETSDNIAAIQQGLSMIGVEYQKALDELGIVKFDAVDQKFDPELHDAVANETSDSPEGTVIKQWNCGYKIGDRLLRPARVVVSSGPAAE